MTAFSVGTFSADEIDSVRGQKFTPTVPGPNGSGSPGSASQIFIRSISVGYATSNANGRAQKVYVYSVELDSVDQIGQSANLVAESVTGGYADGSGMFGTGTYSRTFTFTATACGVAGPYYFYFDRDQSTVKLSDQNPYSGGNSYDTDMDDMNPECLQFNVTMDTA